MDFAAIHASAIQGAIAEPVVVEATARRGLPGLRIVGLRSAESADSRERVLAALRACGMGDGMKSLVASIAPADVPKAGAALDLPIALALAAAIGAVDPGRLAGIAAHGELGLDGSVRDAPGALAAVHCAARTGRREVLVPTRIAPHAAQAGCRVVPVQTLDEALAHVAGRRPLAAATAVHEHAGPPASQLAELADVRGQSDAARGLEIAAAGGHNLLMSGPPGCGKSMLAARLAGLLPPLGPEAALEVATIHDAAGTTRSPACVDPPIRAPHASIPMPALVGGGSSVPMVGEVTLAHLGVLVLDELPEFRPSSLEALRQPLEEQVVRIRRAGWHVAWPCRAQVVATMNLCRCGRRGSARARAGGARECRCSDASVAAYLGRVSGALLDRFDMHVRMGDLPSELEHAAAAPSSSDVARRVASARQLQAERWAGIQLNADARVARDSRLGFGAAAREELARVRRGLLLGGRRERALVRVARTVADLDGVDRVRPDHVVDAAWYIRSSAPDAGDAAVVDHAEAPVDDHAHVAVVDPADVCDGLVVP